jgi:hypothetical protein
LVQGDYSYVGPTGPNDANDLCKCNTVVYSLMSACDACQGANWFSCVFAFTFCALPMTIPVDGIRGRKTAPTSTLHKRSCASTPPSCVCVCFIRGLTDGLVHFRFSNTVPDGTRVQEWAFIDVTVSQLHFFFTYENRTDEAG